MFADILTESSEFSLLIYTIANVNHFWGAHVQVCLQSVNDFVKQHITFIYIAKKECNQTNIFGTAVGEPLNRELVTDRTKAVLLQCFLHDIDLLIIKMITCEYRCIDFYIY